MKNLKKILSFLGFVLFFTSCEKDETPAPIVTPVVTNPPKDTTTAVVVPPSAGVLVVNADSIKKNAKITFTQRNNPLKPGSECILGELKIENFPEENLRLYTRLIQVGVYGGNNFGDYFLENSISFVPMEERKESRAPFTNYLKYTFKTGAVKNGTYLVSIKTTNSFPKEIQGHFFFEAVLNTSDVVGSTGILISHQPKTAKDLETWPFLKFEK